MQDTTFIEVSLDNLLYNIQQIKNTIPVPRGIVAVVKDCAYGCGASVIAKTLENNQLVDYFAVARFSEAIALRQDGITLPILIFGRTASNLITANDFHDFIYTLNDLADLVEWCQLEKEIRFHVNIDTGMTRMGLLQSEIPSMIQILGNSTNCKCEGILTHLASADVPGTKTVSTQLSIFNDVINTLRSHAISLPMIHFSNSAASIRFGVESCTHIRPGITMYGCKPDPGQDFGINLKPVVSLKSKIVKMKEVPAGTAISYGGNYTTSSQTWIATIPAGYAQGVPRFLSNRGEVLIGGKRYTIAGNVTMDYIMVDAGHSPEIHVGDPVVIIGSQGEETISPDDIALKGNTIGYEVLCHLGTSVNRIYIHNQKEVSCVPGIIF